jgi:Putative translation factor (SUA5)
MGLFTNKSKETEPIISWDDSKTIDIIASMVASGRTFAGTTDTVLGLFSPATLSGFQLLNELKGRSEKPYLILIGDRQKTSEFSDDGGLIHIEKMMDKYWPGPLTIIMNAKDCVPVWMKSHDNKIALRLPNHEPLRALLRKTGPLFSTSANKAGMPVARAFDEIDADIKNEIALWVKDTHGSREVASTIIDCSQNPCVIIRQGACNITD